VSSRTSKPKNGVLATEEGSIYASSVSEPAAVRSAVDAGWRRQSVAGCSGDSIAVITAAHYGCFNLRPAIAEARTLVCELPVLADTDSLSTSQAVIRFLEGLQLTGGSWWQAYLIDYRFSLQPKAQRTNALRNGDRAREPRRHPPTTNEHASLAISPKPAFVKTENTRKRLACRLASLLFIAPTLESAHRQ
jgi:hypothetical protein